MIDGFDPTFDDTAWTLDWLSLPLAQVEPGEYPGGYRVVRQEIGQMHIFGRPYRFDPPFDVRALFDPGGVLWMSDTPQERIMMFNNAGQSHGRVLVGGAGLGLYPQYVADAGAITVVEQSPVVAEIVEPVLGAVMDRRGIALEFIVADVGDYLREAEPGRFDTIFLDTWDRLDAAQLPAINGLREAAGRHLAPGGRVLLWGYRWMVRLFEEACAALLMMPPDERMDWLTEALSRSPRAGMLLNPVAAAFAGRDVRRWELDAAIAECRAWVVEITEEN